LTAKMSGTAPGATFTRIVTATASLGFFPVAFSFRLFHHLVEAGKPATSEQITDLHNEKRNDKEKDKPSLCPLLTHDTLFAMAGLGLVDHVEENLFVANDITQYMVDMPSAQHGALHFSTSSLFASAFLMQKLIDSHFEYPFNALGTPFQYGHQLMGHHELAKEHTYSIMAKQGRMDSFNRFMEGKFDKFRPKPEWVKSLGYDLDSAISGMENSVVMVDIGGGRGETLFEVKEAYPQLTVSNLILQEFNPALGSIPGLTFMEWDYKDGGEQPVTGAVIYSLRNILLNLSDTDAISLMQKISRAMAPYSRLLIHEFSKTQKHGNLHAAMVSLYAGRVRGSMEWHRLATACCLEVTFEAYPPVHEGLIEMRKVNKDNPSC